MFGKVAGSPPRSARQRRDYQLHNQGKGEQWPSAGEALHFNQEETRPGPVDHEGLPKLLTVGPWRITGPRRSGEANQGLEDQERASLSYRA